MIDNGQFNNYKIKMGNKKDKLNLFTVHELPESVRILGIHFDPKAFFNDHLQIVLNKAKYKLYKLQQLARCKYYNFSAHTIYKLYESVIQPKLEYGLCTIANKTKMNILETFQRKAEKIALRIKNQTPSIYLNELLYAKSMSFRLDVARIKLWNNYQRAPPTLLKHQTFKKWKNYILSNGGNINHSKKLKQRQIGRDETFFLDKEKFNFISKSPLSQAYFLMNKIMPIEHKLFRKRKYSILKPNPCYLNQYPNNLNIFGMDKSFNNPRWKATNTNDPVLWEFYTDGSCKPNPGPGGSAYYSKDFDITSKINPINHDTTINYCELDGIKLVIDDCLQNLRKFNQKYNDKKYINIYCDSKFVIDQLDMNGYPQYQYYYELINQIFYLSNQLNQLNVFINIIKIPSHMGINGNEIVDALAKQAAIIAHNCKYKFDNIITFNTFYNPINVDISKDLIFLKKWYKKQREQNWLERQHEWKNQMLEDQYIGNMIMQRYMVFQNNYQYKVRKFSNNLRNQLKHLSQFEAEVINKLRTECINLNGYKQFKYDETNGNCIYCGINSNVEETVEHYILDCPGSKNEFVNYHNKCEVNYNQIRMQMRKELTKAAIFFKEEKNINILNLLFPNIWQQDPRKTNPKYHQILKRNKIREIEVLRCVVRFVKNSKRFQKEKYGL